MRRSYNTQQKEQLLNCMKAHSITPLTVEQIRTHLLDMGVRIGLTTIYRQLERLVDEGVVLRHAEFDGTGAGFQYIGSPEKHSMHTHLVCLKCGQMEHLECAYAEDFQKHILQDHHFSLDRMKTVLYGNCHLCADMEKKNAARRGQNDSEE